MKNYSNDIVTQTRSIVNKLRKEGVPYDDSIMSILVLLFIIDAHKKNWNEPESILNNDGYDFFNNLDFRANDPKDDAHYDTILKYLKKLKSYEEIIIHSGILEKYYQRTQYDYAKVVNQLVEELTSTKRGTFSQISNDSISDAFSRVVEIERFSTILDPCIGSGKLIVDLYYKGKLDHEAVHVIGFDKNKDVALLAYINLTLNGFTDVTITPSDVLDFPIWEYRFDVIISDLPLGLKYNDRKEDAPGIPSTFRFYFLLLKACRKAIKNDGGIFITANSGLIRRFRELANENEDDSVIEEVIDISDVAKWSYTNIKPYILSFEKQNSSLDPEITLVKFSPDNESDQINIIDREEFDFFSNVQDLGYFFTQTFEKIYELGHENFESLDKYFRTKKRAKQNYNYNAIQTNSYRLSHNYVNEVSGFRKVIKENLASTDHKIKSRAHYQANFNDWILAYYQDEIKVMVSEVDELDLPLNCLPLEPKFEFSTLDQDWLVAQLRSDFLQTQIKATLNDTRPGLLPSTLKLKRIFLEPHTKKQKEDFVSDWKEFRIKELESEKKEVQSRFSDVREQDLERQREEEFDLIHDLHHSLKNELSKLTGATKAIKSYLERKEKSGDSVIMTEPVRELRKGADSNLQKSVSERLETLLSASLEMGKYLNDYKSILRFDPKKQNPEWVELKMYLNSIFSEYSGFSFEVTEKIDELKEGTSSPFYLKFDKSVMRLVLSNIITNAIKHGFTDDEIRYSFKVEIQEISIDKEQLLKKFPKIDLPENYLSIKIKNDGNPLSSKIDDKDFFKKGFSFGNTRDSGVGTYHIKKGIESMGGLVSLGRPKNDDVYRFQISLIFPYPIYKRKSELEDEGVI